MTKYYLYIVTSDYHRRLPRMKIGLTMFPIHRLSVYRTGDSPDTETRKYYLHLWEVTAQNKAELRAHERAIHRHFRTSRIRDAETGKWSEWFKCPAEDIVAYVSAQPFMSREVSPTEVKDIQTAAARTRAPTAEEQEIHDTLLTQEPDAVFDLYQRFMDLFLPGKDMRRIQRELWDIVEALCLAPALRYRGIIQWPTGVGKTIGLLALVVLFADYFRRAGQPYRGLLISPKNDIFRTLHKHLSKLPQMGIAVLDGSEGRLSKLTIPLDRPVLLLACHQSLTSQEAWARLPPMTHIHYDEVHRVTGEELCKQMMTAMAAWDTPLLTGTSATPKTSRESQHKKIDELFGDQRLHQCSVYEAVEEKWIARPRFLVDLIPSRADDPTVAIRAFTDSVIRVLQRKDGKDGTATNDGKAGTKAIAYFQNTADAAYAYQYSRTHHTLSVYAALDEIRTDVEFIAATGTALLIACQRYREGSDVDGVGLTACLVRDSIAAHICLQISGRSLRLGDDPNKEGWFLLGRMVDEDDSTTEEEVLDGIVLEITEFLGQSAGEERGAAAIRRMVQTYFGELTVRGRTYSVEETVERVQAAYVRIAYEGRNQKERYGLLRECNRGLDLRSKKEYEDSRGVHPRWVEQPQTYFADSWTTWYHFLGVDTTAYPATLGEWVARNHAHGIRTHEDYKEKGEAAGQPPEPGQMYADYTHWDKVMDMDELW